MQFFLTLLKIWTAIKPYVTSINYVAVLAKFNEIVADYRGGDYAELIKDLVEGLKLLIPDEQAHIRMAAAVNAPLMATAGNAGDCEWAEVQKLLS